MRTIGESRNSIIRQWVCNLCLAYIDDMERCTKGCRLDCHPHEPRNRLTELWEQVETFKGYE